MTKKDEETTQQPMEDGTKVPLLVQETVDEGSYEFVLFSSFIAVCGSYTFGTCIGFTAPDTQDIIRDLNLTVAEFSLFGSILNIGATIGAITCGKATDGLGRKGAMRMSSIITLIGWIAIYFCQGPISLDIGRFLTGWGIGVLSYVVPVYISEIAPSSIRGGLTALSQFMIVIGISSTMLLGLVVTWRSLALHGSLPCAIIFLGLFVIPESPRWLAKVGRKAECEEALRKLRGNNANISYEVAQIQESLDIVQHLPQVGILDLFQRRYIHSMIVAVGLMAFQQLAGVNGIGFYVSEIFLVAGNKSAKLGVTLYAFLQIPINLMSSMLIDRTGRKPLILFAASGTTLACCLTGSSFYLKEHEMKVELVPAMVVFGVVLYICSFSSGFGAVPWVTMSELYICSFSSGFGAVPWVTMSEIFPLHVKGVAGSTVNLVHWVLSWLVSYTFNFLFVWSPAGTFYIYGVFNAGAIFFILLLMPETKGKTLEEIQASMQ